MKTKIQKEKGLTLIECLIAMVITLIGVLAVFQLVAYSLSVEQFAAHSTEATTIAVNKIEELKVGSLADGGSLTSNVTSYSDTTNPLYTIRWTIGAGSVGVGTKQIVIEVSPRNQIKQNAKIRLETLIR
jgi:prepilin-type N-terminal cleavage/methylation domain-containing protein